jgi:hypothetical protein
MSAKDIVKTLSLYLEMFPECKLSPTGLNMYAATLSKYSVAQVKAAMDKLMADVETGTYFPKPAHIIKAINDLAVHVSTDGRGIPDAGEAFREMIEQAKLHSVFTDKWEFSTPAIAKAVQRFGKNTVLYMNESDIGIARAQFRKIYEEELHKQAERKLNNEVLQGGAMADLVNKLAGKSRVLVLEGRA